MASQIDSALAYAAGICLVVLAVAGVVPPGLAATFGIVGVGLMGVYALKVVRSGALRGGVAPPDGTDERGSSPQVHGHPDLVPGDGRAAGDTGWFGGDFGGGGGDGGGGGGGG